MSHKPNLSYGPGNPDYEYDSARDEADMLGLPTWRDSVQVVRDCLDKSTDLPHNTNIPPTRAEGKGDAP